MVIRDYTIKCEYITHGINATHDFVTSQYVTHAVNTLCNGAESEFLRRISRHPVTCMWVSTHLGALGLGLKARVGEGQAAVITEQADEGTKCHRLDPVVDF